MRAYKDVKTGRLKAEITGIRIHYVVDEVDRGAPVLTHNFRFKQENQAKLEERIYGPERVLIVKATALLAVQIVSA